MANYTDGCEECEEYRAFCSECFADLPKDLRDAEIQRIRMKHIRARKAREQILTNEGVSQ